MTPRSEISLVVPSGWRDVKPVDVRGIRELVAPGGSSFRASLLLMRFDPPAGTPPTLEAIHRAALDDLALTMTDASAIAESAEVLGGLPAVRSTLEFRQGRFRLVAAVVSWGPFDDPRVALGLSERGQLDDAAAIDAVLASIVDPSVAPA